MSHLEKEGGEFRKHSVQVVSGIKSDRKNLQQLHSLTIEWRFMMSPAENWEAVTHFFLVVDTRLSFQHL